MNETAAAKDRRKQATNLSLDAVLKTAAAQFCADNGISLSDLTGNYLERKLVEAGYLTRTDTGLKIVTKQPFEKLTASAPTEVAP